ncbi:hypothetical protein FIBSPDRAFT_858825 [Athelia psychrophila]|uniref:Uncharacterized protein n=1 Tax=Athelia psychrophila TaxID=1759441 RepID=A0A166LPT3_9AGAM|nr:hypothetical protein FIBSPDRAFT_858825 [Fibularhizoctonia sp. CBS 109695]
MSHTILESVRFRLLPPSLCLASTRVFFRWDHELTIKEQDIRERNAPSPTATIHRKPSCT